MRIMLIVIVIMIAAAMFIVYEQKTDFKTMKSVYDFGATYFKWMGMVVDNAKGVAGSVSKMKWVPETNNINN
ncbi:MAG: hypothetical protein V1660_04165 [archaeon]